MATVHDAARDGDLAELARHLRADSGAVRQLDEYLRTPLHWAALRGHRGLVEWLLANGANPDARDRDGFTPYGLAAHGERLDDRRAADKRAAAATSWPYPQVWRWPFGRVLRGTLFTVFLLVAAFGLALVRPGCVGRNWNTVEVLSEPRLISGDYAHKPLKAMAGSGRTLAVLTEDGEVYLLDTETRLSRTLCRGITDLASDDRGTVWLLRADGGIDRAVPLAVGGFTVEPWQPPAQRYWKTSEFKSADVLATDIDADGWLVASPGGVARYRMNPDGANRQRAWQTAELSNFDTKHAAVVPSGVWMTGATGGVRFAERATLESHSRRRLAAPEIATFNAGAEEPWASAVDVEGKLWLYPPADTGWVGPLFAPNGTPGPPSAEQLTAAVLHAGQLTVGTKADGLFAYSRSERRFHRLGTHPVERLVPVSGGGVLWLGKGLRHVPPSATGEPDVRVLDDGDVTSADVSPSGGLCVYERLTGGDRSAILAVSPADGGTPFVLASNEGWTRMHAAPAVHGVFPFGNEQLIVTDAGAVRYDAGRRKYTDHSRNEKALLRFRHADRSGDTILAVTDANRLFQTSLSASKDEPWTPIDLGPFGVRRAVTCGAGVFASGMTAEGVRGLAAKVGDAKPTVVATRRHDATVSFANTPPVADLHTPADGSYRLTLAGAAKDGRLPVFSFSSAVSDTSLSLVPWADSRPPKQVRWHPTAGQWLLHATGEVSDAGGDVVFGQGSSPFQPTEATALTPSSATGVLLGGRGGRVAEYDWKRGLWSARPAIPGDQAVEDIGFLAGTAFARTTTGVWSNVPGRAWQRIPDAARWLVWTELQESRGWLVGPDGARPTTARPDPDAKPDRATASGVAAFLDRARHVWRPDSTTGDWVAFTDTTSIGRYSAATDTWTERALPGFRTLSAVIPAGAEGVVLSTDAGLFHLSPTVRQAAISENFGSPGDTVAVVNGDVLAAAAEPTKGILQARGWRRGKVREADFVASFRAERVAAAKPPPGLSVVAAAPSAAGLLLLSADGRVVEYNPDIGEWRGVQTLEPGEVLVGWYDSLPVRMVTTRDGLFRLRTVDSDGTTRIEYETVLPPDEWPAAVRAALPAITPPAESWFQRRARHLDADHGRPGGFALAGGLLKPARAWHLGALAAPPTLRTGGAFPWTRGTGVEVRRDQDGKVEFRLADGPNTRPLTAHPDGGFIEDRFSRLGLGAVGEFWGFQDEPRQLVRLFVRNGGLARDLTVEPLPLPDHLDPLTAPDGRLEFRDRFRPGLYWSISNNVLVARPTRHTPPLPAVPVGDASLTFERVGFDGVKDRLAAHLEIAGVRRSAWQKTSSGLDRPVWTVASDCALAGKLVLVATPAGIAVRDRGTFGLVRIVPTDNPVSIVRDGAGEVLRIDAGADSFEWIDGPIPLKKVPREAVTRVVRTGGWEWRMRYLSADARRVEAIADAGGRKRKEVSAPSIFGEPRWTFADDRVNWIGKPADGADLFFATDDGVWPVAVEGRTFVGRGAALVPGERVERLRCPAGATWATFDGANWTAVHAGNLVPQPGAAVPAVEAAIPKHPAWGGTLTDGAVTLVPTDGANRAAFEEGQPYFDRLDGLASVGGRLFTLAFHRAVIERDPVAPASVLAVRPLPADLPTGWPHQVEQSGDELHLTARKPDSDEWKRWRFDPVGGGWTPIPAAQVDVARVLADTGAFRWRAKEPGGPLVPVLNPTRVGEGPWPAKELPDGWWWQDDRFAWDVVTGAAALDDTTALLVTAAGPMTVTVADGRGTVARMWPGLGYLKADAARLSDGRKVGVFVGGTKPQLNAFFDSASKLPDAPGEAARRESVVIVARTDSGVDFTAKWDDRMAGALVSALGEVGLPTELLIRDGQFAFDAAATACPIPGQPNRWATVTPDGLVCVFDVAGPGKPVVLRSLVPSKVQRATAMRADSPAGVLFLDRPDDAPFRFEWTPTWVPLQPGATAPAGNVTRALFRSGSRVTVDPARLLWTRTDRYLTDGHPPVPRHETGREPFTSDAAGVALAADVATGIAVIRRPAGLELSVVTRGGLMQTNPGGTDGDTALSFPNVKSIAVPGGGSLVRYGPTGETWVRSAEGGTGKVVRDEWRPTFGGWIDDPWPVAGRRVTFPPFGGVAVNGVPVTESNNSWRVWQRPFGPVIDVYPQGDVIWAATRVNGVFKVHPDKLVPQ